MYLKVLATTALEEGAESIDGIQKVDDKTVQFTTKEEMPITTF